MTNVAEGIQLGQMKAVHTVLKKVLFIRKSLLLAARRGVLLAAPNEFPKFNGNAIALHLLTERVHTLDALDGASGIALASPSTNHRKARKS